MRGVFLDNALFHGGEDVTGRNIRETYMIQASSRSKREF
jgi:hypothetical protein